MADGKGFEVARAYVTIVPSMQGSQKTITQELTGVTETASVEAGEKSGKKLGEGLAKGLKTTAKVIGAAMTAATAAAVATGKAFIDAANSTAEFGDSIDKNSQKMGISAKAYQEWDYIMKRNGSTIDSLKKGFMNISSAMNDLNGATDKTKLKGAAAAIDSLGVSVKDAAGNMKSQDAVFSEVITALQDIGDESARSAKAQAIFGKGAQEIGPLLNMNSKDTEALKKNLADLGGIMSDDAVKAAADYSDKLTDMQTAMSGLKNNVMSQFLPSISSIMTGLSKMFSGNGGIDEVQSGLKSLMDNINKLAPQFLTLAGTIVNSLISGFAPMLPSLVSTLFSFLTQAIVTISGMMPQLLPAIISGIQGALSAVMSALPIIFDGLTQLVMSIVTWLSSEENVAMMISGIIALVAQLADSLSIILPVLIPALVEIISQLAIALTDEKNIKVLIQAALTLVGALVVAIGKALTKIPALIKGVFTNLGNLFASFLEFAVPKVADGITLIVNKVKTFGSTLATRIKTWFSTVISKIGGFVGDIVSRIKDLPIKALEIGKDLITGLWKGISDKIEWVKSKIKSMGESITKAIKKVFGVASPSKVFAEVGGFLADGLAVGYEKEMKNVRNDMLDASDGLTANMTTSITANATGANLAGSTTTYNGGAVTVNVYGAEGQSVSALADAVAEKLEAMTARKKVVYA